MTTKTKYLFLFLLGVSYSLNLSAQEIQRTFKWTYDGNLFTQTFTFRQSDYNYYRNLPKNDKVFNYIKDHDNGHLYLLELAETLDKYANALEYTGHQLLEYLIAFVQQSTPYKTDPDMTAFGGGDYCKHPIETLVENGGDCEDKAILLAALLKMFEFDAILLNLSRHYAIAISCNGCSGSYYNYNGKKYYFIETTSIRKIGDIPDEYSFAYMTFEEIPNLVAYERKKLTKKERRLYANTIEKTNQRQNGKTVYMRSRLALFPNAP